MATISMWQLIAQQTGWGAPWPDAWNVRRNPRPCSRKPRYSEAYVSTGFGLGCPGLYFKAHYLTSRIYRMKISTLTALAAAGILASTAAFADTTAQCVNVNKEQIPGLFDKWNASLKTGNPDTVTANYSDDAILLPTVSNKPRTNHAEIRDYFVHFLQKHPQGTIDSRTIKLGDRKSVV